jgi:hypothetical protein
MINILLYISGQREPLRFSLKVFHLFILKRGNNLRMNGLSSQYKKRVILFFTFFSPKKCFFLSFFLILSYKIRKKRKNVTQSRFIEMIYKKDIYVKGLMTGVTLGLQI